MERETGIEPATNSLEGCDSTTELLPPAFETGSSPLSHFRPQRGLINFVFEFRRWWTGEDSNLRRPHGPADLQSAAFDRSATCPELQSQEAGRQAPCVDMDASRTWQSYRFDRGRTSPYSSSLWGLRKFPRTRCYLPR